jgi:Uma2 family endonuclease
LARRHGRPAPGIAAAGRRAGDNVDPADRGSLPDPDCWVRRADAEPIGTIGSRLSVWDAADVLLVVEVADETTIQDLNIKAKLYGQAGYPVYWVITQEAIYEHTGPIPTGYRTRVEYLHGESISVPYASTELAVDELVAASPS